MSKVSGRLKWAIGGLLTMGLGGGVWWVTRPEPPPEPVEDVAAADEKDPSREETEDLMRKIGYVQ